MSGPREVKLKRMRCDEAPEALFVERPGKRQEIEKGFHYVLRKDAHPKPTSSPEPPASTQGLFNAKDVRARADSTSTRPKQGRNASGSGLEGVPRTSREKRTYHLKRPSTPEAGIRKRKARDEAVATFVEKRARQNAQAILNHAVRERSASQVAAATITAEPLKRPGRHSATRTNGYDPSLSGRYHMRSTSQMEAIAQSLQQFAVDEATKELSQSTPQKPKVVATPKLSGERSRAIHQSRASQSSIMFRAPGNETDASMEDEADYVYDTYVLAPSSGVGATQADSQGGMGNVGYLIIGEEDEAVWETYMEEELSEEEPSDEDDENAEDWYGADYPDDELASDDEFDRNAHHYHKKGAPDDEEWDEHTFSDDEYERQMNPWRKKTPQQFARYLNGTEPANSE